MAILKITTDEEFLRKKSKPVTEFDARLHGLLEDMRDTLESTSGVGLAAVQIGVLKRVAIVTTPRGILSDIHELVNPEITEQSHPKRGEEACLSIPGESAVISRPHRVTVRAVDRYGKPFTLKLTKLGAVCACHEIDHMDGVLFTDYIKEQN